MSNPKLKNIVEGFLFASDKALNADHILKMFPETERPEKSEIVTALEELEADFESHGVELKKVSTGYRFQVKEEYTQWVSRLWDERPQKYTRALLETLALVVYRQPITRGEIEEIRGVSVSSNIVRTLQERGWIKIVGHRDVPGRPSLLASTKEFLDYFNLQSLEDLPPLSEIKDLDAIAIDLDPEQNAALLSAIKDMQEEQQEQKEKKEQENPTEGDAESSEGKESESEEAQVSAEVESVETISAELDVVLVEEEKIEQAEEAIEHALHEQTDHNSENESVETVADDTEENKEEEMNAEDEITIDGNARFGEA